SKPVILENRVSLFGLIPPLFIGRVQGHPSIAEEWPTDYWENGYRKMIFFHPEISYKQYKNDLNELDKISRDKLIELGVSFDKPYKVADIPTILPNVKKSWYWVDAFRKSDLEQYKTDAKENDAKSTFIREDDVLGVSDHVNYSDLLELLKSSKDKKYNEIYNELLTKGYTHAINVPILSKDKKSEGVLTQNTDSSNVPILGAVVYGTKDELKSLIGNPHIKAASFGVVVDKY
ncbi:MAG TPA: anti sigma factor C-terminal domain-containing protein, partial [Desulfosporosinus sp.]|nr:anti sigma factor C-terminal domain-containing protein [Desulfosporosinus sp.]